jgi:hypothetical protein
MEPSGGDGKAHSGLVQIGPAREQPPSDRYRRVIEVAIRPDTFRIDDGRAARPLRSPGDDRRSARGYVVARLHENSRRRVSGPSSPDDASAIAANADDPAIARIQLSREYIHTCEWAYKVVDLEEVSRRIPKRPFLRVLFVGGPLPAIITGDGSVHRSFRRAENPGRHAAARGRHYLLARLPGRFLAAGLAAADP